MNIVNVVLKGKLHHGEEQMFRGAFVRMLGPKADPLFHNHEDSGLRFAYPLVQYKVVGGRPSIVGLGDGADLLKGIKGRWRLTIGKQPRLYEVDEIMACTYSPEFDICPKMYSLSRYIPLNRDNLAEYESLPALTDRVRLLENIICANILSFFKGIGYHCEEEIYVAVSSIDGMESLYYKGVRFKGFNLRFVTNIVLPDNIGLGKSPNIGFGLLQSVEMPERFG